MKWLIVNQILDKTQCKCYICMCNQLHHASHKIFLRLKYAFDLALTRLLFQLLP